MTLRYTENSISTTAAANKLILLSDDNKLPIADGSNLFNVPGTNNLQVEQVNDVTTFTLSVNKLFYIANSAYATVTNIYFPATAATGDRIYIHLPRDTKNKYILNIQNNNILHYKLATFSNQSFDLIRTKNLIDQKRTTPNLTALNSNTMSSYNTFYKLICYNDGTNINWIDENNISSIDEISSTIKSNFNNNEVLCTSSRSSDNLSNTSFVTKTPGSSISLEFTSAYNLASYNIATSFYTNWATLYSYVDTINIIVNSSTITSLTLPIILSYPQCIRFIRGQDITQAITLNVGNTTSEKFHTKNSAIGIASNTYTWNHNRSINFLPNSFINTNFLTNYSWIIFGET